MSASSPESPSLELLPGAVVGGKYRIDGFLGEGGMGVVLSATHLELDAPVAIKIVREELAEHEEVVARLLFEARAAARMRSTHIVRVLDVARLDSGAPYIVMEQLRGSDLAAVLVQRGPLPVREAIRYLLQVCEGLAEAHELGIIHRDLKPENLFLAETPEGVVLKILDFGVSKDVGTALRTGRSTLTKTGSAVGSPYYMAPEQMRASPSLDARADIWSLGAILFELLTGRCPFEAESPAMLCSQVMIQEAPSLGDVASGAPAELEAIVRRCLEKQPSARFQNVTELAWALRSVVKELNSTVTAAPLEIPIDEQAPHYRSKRGTSLALLGVSALMVLAGAGFWQLQGRSELARWFQSGHADTAELSQQIAASVVRPPREPEPPASVPVLVTPAASVVAATSVVAANVAPQRAVRVTAQRFNPAPVRATAPRAVPESNDAAPPPPEPEAPPIAAPVRDSVGARYDL